MSVAAKRAAWLLAAFTAISPAVASASSTVVVARVCHATFAATTLVVTSPNPTSVATAEVAGTADPGSSVSVTNGGSLAGTVLAASDGSYLMSVPLHVGSNTLVATASDACGHTAAAPAVSVHRDLTAPLPPTLNAPAGGTAATEATVDITGSAEPLATVAIQLSGVVIATVQAASDGSFGVRVPLPLGTSSLTATATNGAGTSPVSVALALTRSLPLGQPVATPSPAPTPAPAPAVPLTVPVVVSPTSGTATTATSVVLVVRSAAGQLEVRRGGTLVASLIASSEVASQLSIPLELGDNVLTIRLRTATATSDYSEALVVTRQAAPPIRPIIAAPAGGWSVNQPFVNVAGSAEPGAVVEIIIHGQAVARVQAGDDGRWAARIALEPGETLLYAQIATAGGTVRSDVVTISYGQATVLSRAQWLMTVVVTAPAAAVALAGQGVGDAAAAMAASPVRTGLVLGVTVLAATASSQFAGLALLWQLPALAGFFLAGAWRARGRRGRVTDIVTGQPVPLASVKLDGASQLALTDRRGEFVFPPGAPLGVAVTLSRAGYRPLSAKLTTQMTLEPVSHTSRLRLALHILGTGLTWLLVIIGTAAAIIGAVNHPSWWRVATAGIFIVILITNALLAIMRPHRRFGHLVDTRTGRPVTGVHATLLDARTGETVSRYESDASGRYTLYAPPGHYRLQVEATGYQPYTEAVQIMRHRTYFGFTVRMRPVR